ncbi:MAG: hypothetical protein LBC29_06130, partial [Propionibacteriaceae bacterium]|nr:hypothetical protein [Propionibacteriaceae bacterium]
MSILLESPIGDGTGITEPTAYGAGQAAAARVALVTDPPAADDLEPSAGRGAGERLVADLLAGVLLYGGIGYLLERFLGVPHALWIGVVVGLVL